MTVLRDGRVLAAGGEQAPPRITSELFDPATGACYDGLRPDWVNQNQGAESTLAFLLARLDLQRAEAEVIAAETAQEAWLLLRARAAGSRA